jgi:hypothetical protein
MIALVTALLASLISVNCGTPATPPATAWTKTFGGADYDYGMSVRQTSDGGYIITGYTASYGAGDYDVWLIKADSSGNMAWNKTFGGSHGGRGYSVQQTSDGGYIIVGSTELYGTGDYDIWLIKTDPSGNMAWNKTFGGSHGGRGYSVQQTSDGGYVVAGYAQSYGAGLSDVWLIKTDSSVTMAWNKTYGSSDYDYAFTVQQTLDGGYIIAGQTASHVARDLDIWLIKTDSSGTMAWNKTFGSSDFDIGNSVQQNLDGGYIIAGYTNSYGAGGSDVWLIKADSSGDETWNKTFGGLGGDLGYSVQQTSDGGYIIAGSTTSYGAGHSDVWLIKVSAL